MTHKNQRVLITAAASGIGRATAQAFLDAGAKVYICDVDAKALEKTLKGEMRLAGMVADVGDEAQVGALFKAALGHLGGLDILINNAGIAGPTALVEDVSLADWRRCLSVNLDGAFLCARQAAPILKKQKSGSIINLSSTAGLFGFARRTPYCSAKWAIVGLTKTLAMELGPYGVRCNAICPGAVEGDRIDGVIARDAEARGLTEAQVREEYTRGCSLRTMIKAEDIASAMLFLTSAAGAKITGQAVPVDGHTEVKS